MTLQTATKKPVKINFWEWTGGADEAYRIIHWIEKWGGRAVFVDEGLPHHLRYEEEVLNGVPLVDAPAFIAIHTLEGWHRADVGDRIIKGVIQPPAAPDFYPCKPSAFHLSYDIVED